eukprot:80951-Pyramimonas_sp.AAC.1
MARHCAEYALSSGGWGNVGDLIQKMTNDGVTRATTAPAMHGLTTLPPGEIDVLSVRADDIANLEQTHLIEQWRSFLNPYASRDAVVDEEHGDRVITIDRGERAAKPMPLFFRACQGHSCFAHSIERMHAPCEFGMARCHEHLLH